MSELQTDARIVDSNGRPTSYLENFLFDLGAQPGSPTSSEAGSPGQVKYDGTYLYICYDIDSWGRIAFTTGY